MQTHPPDADHIDPDRALCERIRQLASLMQPSPTGLKPRLEPLNGIRAVLFDVYGTLVISGCGDISLSSQQAGDRHFRQALTAAGADMAALPEHFDGAWALREAIAARHARSRDQGIDYPEVDILEIWNAVLTRVGIERDARDVRRIALEYELLSNPVWPMPGLCDVVDALNHRGYVLGVVSNAQFYTPLMLSTFLGRDITAAGFEPSCCAWSYQHLIGKPSKRLFLPALAALREEHDIAPEQVLYVGNDLRNDIWPADGLGCRTALFAGDARSLRLREHDTHLCNLRPDRVLTSLDQIILDLLPS